MQAKELISDIFPAVNISDIGEKALVRMDFFKTSHIPLIDLEGNYFGLISENEIYDFNLAQKQFSKYKKVLIRPYINDNQHIFDVVNLFSNLNISVLPVLNDNGKYLGSICFSELRKYLKKFFGEDNLGVIFTIELSVRDYSLVQISQIIEENNAKILSLFTSTKKDSSKLELSIKINTSDFSSIRQSLERYGYFVKSSYSKNDKVNDLLNERYEEFMNYLNI